MIHRIVVFCAAFLTILVLAGGTPDASAQNAGWQVTKASGEVSIASSGVQPAALVSGVEVKPGDTIRTGRNGRVLLTRGEETILIEPNSICGIPAVKKDGMSTTILQKAGSLLLEVEKRNVKHFEVETPYLAAVVKGTQFRVTVNGTGARVDVLRGQVDVADFRSGKHALVFPGQAARVPANGRGGLTLSGSGTFSPILKGEPRTPSIKHEPAGREASPAQRDPSKQWAVTRDPAGKAIARDTANSSFRAVPRQSAMQTLSNGRLQLTAPLGEVKLDVYKATQGLARAQSGENLAGRDALAGGSAGFGTASGGLDGGSLGGGAISSGGIAGGAVSAGGAVASSGGSGGAGGGSAAGGGAGSAGGGGLAGVIGGVTQTVGGVTHTVGGVLGGLHVSDIRLKRDIVQVGLLPNGLGLYRYRYLWSTIAYVGVMAQEVALVRSDAVVRGSDGYLRVDYDALNIPFATWDEWAATTSRN